MTITRFRGGSTSGRRARRGAVAFGTALLSLAWAGGQVIGGSVLSGVADATSDAIAYAVIAAGFALTLTLLAILRPRERLSQGAPSG